MSKPARNAKPSKSTPIKPGAYRPAQRRGPSRPPPRPKEFRSILQNRGVGIAVTGVAAFAVWGGYWWYKSPKSSPTDGSTPVAKTAATYSSSTQEDVSNRYDSIATKFDSEVANTEFWAGINHHRKKLVRQASGHVLEVSAGTGRNTKYYDLDKCKSITFIDQSGPMLDIAYKKWMRAHRRYTNVRFLITSALDPIPLPEDEDGKVIKEGYDTIVQTIGLCSTPEPERLLRNIGDVLKPEGKILLLEHGRGHYQWLNKELDDGASKHADKFGCWWNRDIGAIAKNSGLDVVKMWRPWFWAQLGTLWWLEMRRPKDFEMVKQALHPVDPGQTEKHAAVEDVSADESSEQPYRPWWKFWG